MNHPHHHHHHPHHHHPHPHAGVAIGPLPNPCIGMVAAPTAAGPVLAGIGVPIMTAAAPALVPPPPIPPSSQPTPQKHAQGTNKKLVMSSDSSDDKDKCGQNPFIQARTSPSGAVVVSCSAAVSGAGSQLTWSSPTPTGPIMPAGIAYPVMGLPPGALAAEANAAAATGMIYGVPIAPAEHQVSAGVNTVISLPSSSGPAVVTGVQPPPPPSAMPMSSVIPTQNNPVVATTTLPPQGIAQKLPQQQQQGAGAQQQPQQPVKEIIHCKSCTLFPPNPNAPPPTTREKPPGCRTAFVGGLPDNIREDIVREIFERCGEITTIRMSKKNFCHIRFEMEEFVEAALYLSGYRIRIGSNSDSANIGRLHVDYAQARDDLYEWECRQRQLLREQRHRERLEQERLHPPSPPPSVHYSDHEATNVAERIKGDDTFMKAIQILFTWLEKGECVKRNSNNFYSMIQSTNSQIRRLLNEKTSYEEDFQRAKDLLRQRMTGLLMQFTQIEKVFSAACQRKVWDHFSKAQRKNIEVWKKQVSEIKNVLLEEALNERADEEMELSDLESDSSGQSNKENGEPPRAKKMRLAGTVGGEDAKTVHQLKEENDALRCQLEASKNEVDLIKADLRSELEMKEQQLKNLQQQVIDAQSNSGSCSPSPTVVTSCPSSADSMMLSPTTGNHGTTSSSVTTESSSSSSSSGGVVAGAIMAKQNLHSPPGFVSSSSSAGFGMSPTHSNTGNNGNGGSSTMTTTTSSGSSNGNGLESAASSNRTARSSGSSNAGSKEVHGYCDSSSSSNFLHQQQTAQNNQMDNTNGNGTNSNGSSGGATAEDNQDEIFLGAATEDNRTGSCNKNTSTTSKDNSRSQDEISISEGEARLLGMISTFLHVHPFGASLEYKERLLGIISTFLHAPGPPESY